MWLNLITEISSLHFQEPSSRGAASSPTTSAAKALAKAQASSSSALATSGAVESSHDIAKLSWRSKAWHSEATSKARAEDFQGYTAEPSSPGAPRAASRAGAEQPRPAASARKHSLTVPGEPRYIGGRHHHHSHHHSHHSSSPRFSVDSMGHQATASSEPKSIAGDSSKKLDRSRSPSPLSTPSPSGGSSM